MQRHILAKLKTWYEKSTRKPLVIQGARQVGKTWLMKHFGEQHFAKVAYINFDNNERMKVVFEGDFDVHRLLLGLQIESGVDIEPENTLLIFDEIQEVKSIKEEKSIAQAEELQDKPKISKVENKKSR